MSTGANLRRAAGAFALAAPVWVAASCITTYEDVSINEVAESAMPVAVSQTIPFPGGAPSEGERLFVEFYGAVLERLEAAAAERDVPQLEALLDGYERPGLAPWLQSVLTGYRGLAGGLRFQRHAAQHATLTLASSDSEVTADEATAATEPPIGAPLCFVLRLPAAAEPVHLGGVHDDDPIAFLVSVSVDDTFVDGSTRSTNTREPAWLPEPFVLAGDTALEVPIGVDVPAGESVKRVVHVRLDLMPGYVRRDGVRVPVQRTAVGAAMLTQWPAGHEAVVKAPVATLRRALEIGDAAHFPHVFLAAQFARGADREIAVAMLIDQLRFGRDDQAQVAMAALAALTGEGFAVGDRRRWLEWWQQRAR